MLPIPDSDYLKHPRTCSLAGLEVRSEIVDFEACEAVFETVRLLGLCCITYQQILYPGVGLSLHR